MTNDPFTDPPEFREFKQRMREYVESERAQREPKPFGRIGTITTSLETDNCPRCGGLGKVFSRVLDLGQGDGPERVVKPCPDCSLQ